MRFEVMASQNSLSTLVNFSSEMDGSYLFGVSHKSQTHKIKSLGFTIVNLKFYHVVSIKSCLVKRFNDERRFWKITNSLTFR